MKFKEIYNKKLILVILQVIIIIFVGSIPAINPEISKSAPADKVIEPSEIIYVVKPGDSLAQIAYQYKVHRYQIRQWNNISTDNILRPGQELIIKRVEYPAYEGLASWYGPGFHGQNMANGEIYNMNDIVVAHRTLPLGSKVKVTNLENGKSVIAPVLDRGPYVKNSQGEYTREIDLSYAVAQELETIHKGVVLARVEPISEPLPIQ